MRVSNFWTKQKAATTILAIVIKNDLAIHANCQALTAVFSVYKDVYIHKLKNDETPFVAYHYNLFSLCQSCHNTLDRSQCLESSRRMDLKDTSLVDMG